MEITNVKVESFHPKEKGICAKVTVVLDDCLAIHNISVLRGSKGMYIGYPSLGDAVLHHGKKRYTDLVHPLDNSLSKVMKDRVLLEYEKYRLSLTEV